MIFYVKRLTDLDIQNVKFNFKSEMKYMIIIENGYSSLIVWENCISNVFFNKINR